jgi:hypothetical protein
MKRLVINMTIGSYSFDFIHSLEIDSSWEMLTDTCLIKLPSNLKIDKNKLRSVIKPGDSVSIEIGYDDQLTKVFDGFITGIRPKTPVEISCEDSMYSLKSTTVKGTIRQATLKKILDTYFPGIDGEYEDIEIGTILFDNLSQAKILDKLRETRGIYSFMRKGKLVVGKIYDQDTASNYTFRFQYNILDENLQYQRKEDMKLKVTAVSNNPDGTIKEVKVGDNDGEERTLNYYNVGKDTLEKYALAELNRLKYDGWHGEFTAFGEPVVFHGDIVKLEDPLESDKTGEYWVDKVVYTFGVDGFRQVITLGPKL